jgi:GNAT superfamily N-acetyltransferase
MTRSRSRRRPVRRGRDTTLCAVPSPDTTIDGGTLSTGDVRDAAMVGARAFHTDPFFEYLSPNSVRRARGLSLYCQNVCKHLGPKGRLLVARREGRVVGVAGWVAPGGYPQPIATQLAQQVGALHALYRVPPALLNGTRYLRAMEKAHPKEELWYLQLLATDPEHQRTGVGSALLEGTLAECDRDGIASYLETQKEDNLAYYGRFGYEVVSTLTPVASGPPLWAMRREPRPGNA